jgi:galactitol-specific phosphotransferase system IIB component
MTESMADLARKHEISMNYKAPVYMVLTEKGWIDTRETEAKEMPKIKNHVDLINEVEKLEEELKRGPEIVAAIKEASDKAKGARNAKDNA